MLLDYLGVKFYPHIQDSLLQKYLLLILHIIIFLAVIMFSFKEKELFELFLIGLRQLIILLE